MVLVDTPIWVDHLRSAATALGTLLDRGEVLCHPFVIGELACGNLRNRSEILRLLGTLPRCKVAESAEVLFFIETRLPMGRGIGFVDASLLASVALQVDTTLWTADRRLRSIAEERQMAYQPA